MTYFKLTFADEHLPHHDLVLDIPSIGFTRLMDTYYYWLDNGIGADVVDKAKAVLSIMLKNWIDHIGNLRTGEECFLPLDLSDNYIGCFSVCLKEHQLAEVTYGFTEKILGMEIAPTDPDISRSVWMTL